MADNRKKNHAGLEAGLGMAALAAAAAGAYFFYGNHGKKHQQRLKTWAVKAKAETMDKVENMKNFSQQAYDKAVDEVMSKYRSVKNIDPKELTLLGKELKGHWQRISAAVNKPAKAKSKKRKTK